MSGRAVLWIGVSCCAATIAAFGVSLPTAPTVKDRDAASAMAAVGAPKLKQLYRAWVDRHEANGGDHNIRFLLGSTTAGAHRLEGRSAPSGSARIDAIDGRVSVEVAGLDANDSYRVWLIDDRPGAGNSIQPDPADAYIEVGSLTRDGDRWSLEADLGSEAFRSFQVDQLAVTLEDVHPTEDSLFRGGPDVFQRLYTSLRTPELLEQSDYAVASRTSSGARVFGLREAQAARQVPPKPIEVDPDVVLDDLIRLGADVFINEDFEGNGRTCETCHPFLNNITIDPAELARRPDNDPIFVSEFDPNFAGPPFDLDIPVVLRTAALVGIRDDGLDNPPINRAVPHLFAVNRSFGPAAPVVQPFGMNGAPPAPFPLPDPNSPDPFGLDVTLPPAAQELGGPGGPGAGFPAFGFTIDNATNPPIDRLGFGGDLSFAPEMGLFGRLGDAVAGAIVTLLPRTPARVPGTDFRLPTPQEVAAVTAFYLTLGTQEELDLPNLRLSDPIAEFGRKVFLNPGGVLASFPGGAVIPQTDELGNTIGAGKCNVCHGNAGALSDQELFDNICAGLADMVGLPFAPKCGLTNFNFETGVETLPAQPAHIVAGRASALAPLDPQGLVFRDAGFSTLPHLPGTTPADVASGAAPCFTVHPDPRVQLPVGGFGTRVGLDFPFTDPPVLAGQCSEEFNTPRLVEVADTPPFFHNNNARTLEAAVEFYNTKAFRESSGGIILGALTDGVNGITLENTEIQAISAFLRVINAGENIRSAREFAITALTRTSASEFSTLLDQAIAQAVDASQVLTEAQINTAQVDTLNRSISNLMAAREARSGTGPGQGFGGFFGGIFGADGGGAGNGSVRLAILQLNVALVGLIDEQ